jgi:hypothetical protein
MRFWPGFARLIVCLTFAVAMALAGYLAGFRDGLHSQDLGAPNRFWRD